MKAIPIRAAARIAHEYGYDQVVIIARKTGADPHPHGEHVTTYGVDRIHCIVAARMGAALKRFMGWPEPSSPGSSSPGQSTTLAGNEAGAPAEPAPPTPDSGPLPAAPEPSHGTVLPAPEIPS